MILRRHVIARMSRGLCDVMSRGGDVMSRGLVNWDSTDWSLTFSIVFYTLCLLFLLYFWAEVVLGVASFYFVLGF